MATLSYVRADNLAAAQAVPAAASSGGDKVPPHDRGMLVFRNGDAASKTVTMAVPQNTKYGEPHPSKAYVVPAGAVLFVGPLPGDLANPTDGLVAFTFSAVTSCTVQAVYI